MSTTSNCYFVKFGKIRISGKFVTTASVLNVTPPDSIKLNESTAKTTQFPELSCTISFGKFCHVYVYHHIQPVSETRATAESKQINHRRLSAHLSQLLTKCGSNSSRRTDSAAQLFHITAPIAVVTNTLHDNVQDKIPNSFCF